MNIVFLKRINGINENRRKEGQVQTIYMHVCTERKRKLKIHVQNLKSRIDKVHLKVCFTQ